MEKPFLTAAWRFLVMANYDIDPALLAPWVPHGTELDPFEGRALISVVGFLFQDTKIKGYTVPWHRNFEQVNLRFYVKKRHQGGWRRGVVFLRELVGKRAVVWIAKRCYGEPYRRVPIEHRIVTRPLSGSVMEVAYRWWITSQENRLHAQFQGAPQFPVEATEPHFIIEHYWGYTTRTTGITQEYQVTHPPWRIWVPTSYEVAFPSAASLWGRDVADVVTQKPRSVLVSEGSSVVVFSGHCI